VRRHAGARKQHDPRPRSRMRASAFLGPANASRQE
jgi:hypothetical protein